MSNWVDKPLLPGLCSSYCVFRSWFFSCIFVRGDKTTSYWLEEEDTFERSLNMSNSHSLSSSSHQANSNLSANMENHTVGPNCNLTTSDVSILAGSTQREVNLSTFQNVSWNSDPVDAAGALQTLFVDLSVTFLACSHRSAARFGRFPHYVTFSSQAALTRGVITCMLLILN